MTPVSERDVYEVALLCGGAQRVALAAIAVMPQAGRIAISRTPHRVQVVHCGDGQPAGRAVLDAVPDSGTVLGPVFQDIARPAAVQGPDLPRLAVAGHLPPSAARTAGPFFERPGRAPSLVWAAAGTKVRGTLLAGAGPGLITAISWTWIAFVRACRLAWIFTGDRAELAVYRRLSTRVLTAAAGTGPSEPGSAAGTRPGGGPSAAGSLVTDRPAEGDDMITESAVEWYRFTCPQCLTQWVAHYEVRSFTDDAGTPRSFYRCDGVPCEAPARAQAACPICRHIPVRAELLSQPATDTIPEPPAASRPGQPATRDHHGPVTVWRQFKFKAVISLDPAAQLPATQYPAETHSVMVHASRPGLPGSGRYFPAVIVRDDEQALRPGTAVSS